MLRHIVRHDRVAKAHRLDELGMRAAHLRRRDVRRGVGPKHVVTLSGDCSEEADTWSRMTAGTLAELQT